MAKHEIGVLISQSRKKSGMTQDQFGRKYNVSGPAIFKFEKGYVKPSLDLWLSMSKDIDITDQTAVLMWVQAKLPRKYQGFIDPTAPKAKEPSAKYGKGRGKKKAKPKDPAKLRKEILADRSAPKGLKRLLRDEDIWNLYKPKANELELLSNVFGALGDGNKSGYREALRLVRELGGE